MTKRYNIIIEVGDGFNVGRTVTQQVNHISQIFLDELRNWLSIDESIVKRATIHDTAKGETIIYE